MNLSRLQHTRCLLVVLLCLKGQQLCLLSQGRYEPMLLVKYGCYTNFVKIAFIYNKSCISSM
ncbi:unnamed protein product [Lupinus luteus]|uniref:Uncharacterized protein n=1 Tax=Lupinus luteus TaxID=3873 RepID=A0AAV1XIQ6_LUPLU